MDENDSVHTAEMGLSDPPSPPLLLRASGTVVEQVKRGKASGTKEKWEIEMSGKAKLRTVRKSVATGRTRRGLRSDDLVAKDKPAIDANETGRRRGTRNRA